MKCPKCKHGNVTRLKRQGLIAEKLMPLFGFYPWECKICRTTSFLRNRGDQERSQGRDQDKHIESGGTAHRRRRSGATDTSHAQ